MEDYESAYHERLLDTMELDKAQRHLAAVHWGGVTVECFLKSLIVAGHGISEWKTDASEGPGVRNPSHDLKVAARRYNKLWGRLQKFPEAMKWLDSINTPSVHFIDLRYSSKSPDEAEYREWLNAFQRLLGWLQKQAPDLRGAPRR